MIEAKVFYINDYQIDLLRSVVVGGEKETQVEPKVLKVLLLLAHNQNEVVTHKTIMDEVWQGTEVVPNALQRCIAILRKVLGDDAKSPNVIATHPRIGYRLIADVRWEEDSRAVSTEASSIGVSPKTSKFPGMFLMSLFLLALLVNKHWPDSSTANETAAKGIEATTALNQMTQLTQTDAHESHAIFSPDANYIVFNRYAGSCKSHIWAQHLESGKETQLTLKPGQFGGLSFTSDGRELVFAAHNDCEKSANAQKTETMGNALAASQSCWSVATLDFSAAMTAPQTPHHRYQCQAERLKTPKALANHQYAFLQLEGGKYQLMHYNDLNKELKQPHASDSQYLYHFDYNAANKRFAIISFNQDFRHVLELLDENGELLSRNEIQLDEGLIRYQPFPAEFAPDGQSLLGVSNHRLYKLHMNGQIELLPTPTSNLVSVSKHPTKPNYLAILGNKDIDIAEVAVGEEAPHPMEPDLNSIAAPFNSISRTSAQERHAKYQPKGNAVAFISDRHGSDQIWLWQAGQASQLSVENNQNVIHSFSWSADGSQIAWASENGIQITDVNGETRSHKTDKPIYSVLSWFQEDQFLVLLQDPFPGGLYRLDLQENELKPYEINWVEAAWVTDNQIIFSDTDGKVFSRSTEFESPELTKLSGLNGRALIVANDSIYSVDQDTLILNQYDLQGQLLEPIMQLKPTAWKASDIKEDKLLLNQFIAINHEIVLLQ